ncbi:MAG: prolipoprotein diacylglyceryl transferase [Rhodobacteraceae bacterium]|nr:prolipoprotein diacylglyceryl transferase [Paracoccaceae bacterium]
MIHDFNPAALTTPLGTVYWYGLVYTIGFLGVFLWFWLRRQGIGMSRRDVTTFTIVFAAAVLLGGRLFDIFVYEADYYRADPLAALDWWNGGMASHGVLLGGLVATWAFARSKGIPVLVLLDEIVVPGAFLMAIGRLGNFIEGGVIGSVTSLPWGFIYENVEGPRHPVALYDSAKNLLLVPVLIWSSRVWPPGRGVTAGLFVLLYGLLRFFVDLFRDYEASWLGIGTGQVYNLAMAAAGLVMVVHLLRNQRPVMPPQQPADAGPGWLRVVVLTTLVLYPLGIPTSWTRENITAKREATSEAAD